MGYIVHQEQSAHACTTQPVIASFILAYVEKKYNGLAKSTSPKCLSLLLITLKISRLFG